MEVRRGLDGRSVHHDEEWAAFCYAMAGNGLSYLPPVARTLQQTGRLGDWWGNMFEAIVENLEWCASQR